MVHPVKPLRRLSIVIPALRALWLEVAFGVIGIGLLGTAAYLLAGAHPSAGETTLITTLGVFGVSSATLVIKAKSSASDLMSNLRIVFAADLVVYGVTILPDGPRRKFAVDTQPLGQLSTPVSMKSLGAKVLESE
jgi:hypothetical protein